MNHTSWLMMEGIVFGCHTAAGASGASHSRGKCQGERVESLQAFAFYRKGHPEPLFVSWSLASSFLPKAWRHGEDGILQHHPAMGRVFRPTKTDRWVQRAVVNCNGQGNDGLKPLLDTKTRSPEAPWQLPSKSTMNSCLAMETMVIKREEVQFIKL